MSQINYLEINPLPKDWERRIRKVLKELKNFYPKKSSNFTLVLTNKEKIQEYNQRFLNRNFPTNVLSFRGEGNYLGDILVSVEKAKEEASFYQLPLEDYLIMLVIHGFLHLLDYDHEKGLYAPWLMLKNEVKLCERFCINKEKILNFLRRREYMPAKLAVNVDHVATVREARKTYYPDPVYAAVLAELGGADGIVVHLRLDRRHIKERDVKLIKEIIKVKLILEMSLDKALIEFAKTVKPYQVTLVPEKVEEVTTEGGLELDGRVEEVKAVVKELNKGGIKVSLFLNPEEKVLELAKKTGAQIVELHTGKYAEALEENERIKELERLERASFWAKELGFIVHAGHGLNYENIMPVAALPTIEEFSIGHSIIGRAIMVGIKEAVKEMKELIIRSREGK